jgi:hypothetical protein
VHGGEGGIRTPDTLSGMPVFKTGAINHSATSPAGTECRDNLSAAECLFLVYIRPAISVLGQQGECVRVKFHHLGEV